MVSRRENRSINIYAEIFTNNSVAIDFLKEINVLNTEHLCRCGGKQTITKHKNYANGLVYRCKISSCRRVDSLLVDSSFNSFKNDICILLRLIYLFICNCNNFFIIRQCNITPNTYIKYKKIIMEICGNIVRRGNRKLGGIKKAVQIDETAFKRGKIVRNPSSALDSDTSIMWLVGIIEEESGKIILKFLPNRKIETLAQFISENILEKSIIKTDGHPSYPAAVSLNNCEHIIVPHVKGFKNTEGYTTNNIEGVWGVLKTEMSKRKGVSRSMLNEFLNEFTFRWQFVNNKNPESWNNAIKMILQFSLLNY